MMITANENFLVTLGYILEEVPRKHHSLFVEPACKASHELNVHTYGQLNNLNFH